MSKRIPLSKTDIRPYYQELWGILMELKSLKEKKVSNTTVIRFIAETIRALAQTTGEKYDRYTLQPSIAVLDTIEIKVKLSGLISYLYGKYFFDEINPLSGQPGTVPHSSTETHQKPKTPKTQ